MPDRGARERLVDWRVAERAEATTEEGSVAQRRAGATTRRARWAFEDAARAAAADHGANPETFGDRQRRTLRRLHEASELSGKLIRGRPRPADTAAETVEHRSKRLADDAEIARELDEERRPGKRPGRASGVRETGPRSSQLPEGVLPTRHR